MEIKLYCPICQSKELQNYEILYELRDYEVVRCKRCDLVYVNLTFDEDSLKKSDYYWAEGFYIKEEKIIRRWFEKEIRKIERFIPKGRLLDIGCGFGYLLSEAKRGGWEVYGVEISEKVLNYVKRRGEELNIFWGPLSEAKFEDGYFDLITMFDVIEHLSDPDSVINNVSKLLRKDGLLVVETPREESLFKKIAHLLYRISGGEIDYLIRSAYNPHPGGHRFGFSHSSITKLLKKNNLSLIKISKQMIIFKVLMWDTLRKKNIVLKVVYAFLVAFIWILSRLIGMQNRMVVYARKK